MFRPLDEQESQRVTVWRPPVLDLATVEHAGGRNERPAAGAHAHAPAHTEGEAEADGNRVQVESGAHGLSDEALESLTLQVETDAGFDAGFEAGASTAREALSGDIEALLGGLAREHERWLSHREQDIVTLAQAFAVRVVRRELQTDPQALHALVVEALESLDAGEQRIEVSLHPLDLASLPELAQRMPNLSCIADDTLLRGDCRLRSGASRIDAGVADWLAALPDDAIA